MDSDYSKYDLVIAPFLYMLKDGTIDRIENYVKNGGNFVATYLTGIVDKDDLCYLGGFPADKLKDVFGLWCEETDSLPEGMHTAVSYNNKNYKAINICDILHTDSAQTLGKYESDFYAGTPAVTVNSYGKGKAYYVAFADNGEFENDFVNDIASDILSDSPDFEIPDGVSVRQRGDYTFIMNFSETEHTISLDKEYTDVLSGETVCRVNLCICGYAIIR